MIFAMATFTYQVWALSTGQRPPSPKVCYASSICHRPGVHEGMVVSVVEGEVVEGGILGTHGVGGVRAGRAVVPGEGHHGPAVVEVGGENEAVVVTSL